MKFFLASILVAGFSKAGLFANTIEFHIRDSGRVSLGVYKKNNGTLQRNLLNAEKLPAGTHRIIWDGLDHRGHPVEPGNYEWRTVVTPGFSARYVTTIGINPPGGEHPEPRKSWVGDHMGAGVLDVDESGIYIGSPLTEGGMMMVKTDPEAKGIVWRRPQFYEGGRLTRAAGNDRHLFMLHPNGKLRRLSASSGTVEAEWNILRSGEPPVDIDAAGGNLVAAYPKENLVCWISADNGQQQASVQVSSVSAVTAVEETPGGSVYAAGGTDVYLVSNGKSGKVLALPGNVTAMDYDQPNQQLWVVVEGHKILLVDSQHKVTEIHGGKPRQEGPFDPHLFAGVTDIAADLHGGFLVAEPHGAPRRVAHFNADGSLKRQWFGAMSFYLNGCFDPEDPGRLIGIAPEGWVNEYRIDYERGSWEIVACYQTGRLGDSLFPNAASFRAVRRNGGFFLYHRVVPAVIRLDPKERKAVPVAIAARALNKGRSFFQFAGTGEGGYPKPLVKAAKHHGYENPAAAPGLYSWADTNGNGEFEPEEFRFYENTPEMHFHNAGDFSTNGDFVAGAGVNKPQPLVHLPVSGWEGPDKSAPRWSWEKAGFKGIVTADTYGYGSPRGLSIAPDDTVHLAYQAGLMIRGHGQYEGGSWPDQAVRGCRLLGFSPSFEPLFSVGRQSRNPSESNTGVLYYPMQSMPGPKKSVIVNDQTRQAAQVWTHDGLYVGGVLENRVEDGLPGGFYGLHGDDNQGGAMVTTGNGKTFWLMPYVGHNRLYEIKGWDGWIRDSGDISGVVPSPPQREGTGLKARYTRDGKTILEAVEAPVYYEQFGGERHGDQLQAGYKVEWSGDLEAPANDRYRFSALKGAKESVSVSIDGKTVFRTGTIGDIDLPFDLKAASRVPVRIEYHNPDGRAELKLFLRSRMLDPAQLDQKLLYPESTKP